FVVGGAGFNDGTLTLRNTVVSNNTGIANGASGVAQGGGLANLFAAPGHLVLIDSTVTHNQVNGAAGITVQGGGVYNDADGGNTVGVTDSLIDQNSPDQCFGC